MIGNTQFVRDKQRMANLGLYDFKKVTTGTVTPDNGHIFFCILTLEDSVITTTGSELTSEAIDAGFNIFGKFESVTGVSGRCLAYQIPVNSEV